ncbi:MAG: SRPBCC family protein [Alphaproteobacteria bacterium]
MTITVSEGIDAPRERIWNVITDIDSWADTIAGIVSIEVINRPEAGIVGLKWREKRVLFGKEAAETMWISAAEPNRWYETTAENHGAIYSTRLSMDDSNDKVILTMTFSAKPTTIASKLFSLIGFMFNGTMRKMLQKDLTDIRRVAENTC